MATNKRNPFERLTRRVRELLDELDRLLSPKPPAQPVRVPVPVPVRPDRRLRPDDPYR